jgi:hypothetical protein
MITSLHPIFNNVRAEVRGGQAVSEWMDAVFSHPWKVQLTRTSTTGGSRV